MADLQAKVQAAAGELVAAGTETGLQVAVLRHGRVLADVVSGVADAQTAKPVSPGTLFYAASTAKGVAASLAHVLAERGDITYDLRLADGWPARPPAGDHGRGPVRLGPRMRRAGRRRTLVAAGNPVRLPRADLRLPA